MEVYQAREWQCRYVFPDRRCCILSTGHSEDHKPAEIGEAASAPPRPQQDRPPDTYPWGEQMPQYAVLGVGVDAWVDLERAEKQAAMVGKRNLVHVRSETIAVVMAVLRALRLSDFKASAPSRPEAPPQEPLPEALWEELGGDLCICQHDDVGHWCENCQRRIDIISAAFRRVREAAR